MKGDNTIKIKNRKAYYQYEIVEKFTAGVSLLGTEIKSIRGGNASLGEGYCTFVGDELFLRNMNIAEYELGGYVNHEPRRDRKLLLNRNELNKLEKKIKERGFSIIPLTLFFNSKGFAKIDIALARGKKQHDKRQDIKAKDSKRELDRLKKIN